MKSRHLLCLLRCTSLDSVHNSNSVAEEGKVEQNLFCVSLLAAFFTSKSYPNVH